MKRIFTFIATGLISSLGYGQTEQKIHKSDGSILQLPLSGIDSINFSVSPPASMNIHQEGNSTESVLLNDIDSITYIDAYWGQPMMVTLAGRVSDESGRPLSGVTINIGNLTTTCDGNGVFFLPDAPVKERMGYVTASLAGWFPGSRTFLPTEGINTVNIRMLRKNVAGTIQAVSGGTVQSEGVKITFAGGSFVQNGNPFNGQVQVSLNYIDPESDHFDNEMPGNLLGMMNGTAQGLISYGMFAAELTDNAGNKVELATGTTAQVRFPLSATLQATAPEQIDLWYFDENAGLWQHEGTAIRQGNEYTAAVSHFSFWNCDIPFPYEELNGTITDEEGNPVSGAKVTLYSPTRGSASDYTSSSGHFGGFVPSGEALTLKVSLSCDTAGRYEEVYSQQTGPFSQKTTLSAIPVALSFTQVSGAIKGCQNASVNSGYIIHSGNACFADTGGNFSFVSCAGGSIIIKAFTSQPWSSGESKSIDLTGAKVQAGELLVCGNTGGGTVTDIDGNEYFTVIIGTLEWMAENLKTSKFADGTEIPNVTADAAWAGLTTPAWCNYANNAGHDDTYGKLYNWYAVADSRNVCPTGWHVPTDAEWTTLTTFLGGEGNAGGKMKAVTGWSTPNTGATNESGFSALPGGRRNYDGPFGTIGGGLGFWWSSTEGVTSYAWSRYLSYNFSNVTRINYDRRVGLSVRCVRD